MAYYNNWQYNPYSSNMGGTAQQIIKVNGKKGAEAYSLGPNSQALLLDESAPIVWLAQTDGAGYKTITGYDLTPHVEISTEDYIQSLESRLKALEEKLNEQSNPRTIEQTANRKLNQQHPK